MRFEQAAVIKSLASGLMHRLPTMRKGCLALSAFNLAVNNCL